MQDIRVWVTDPDAILNQIPIARDRQLVAEFLHEAAPYLAQPPRIVGTHAEDVTQKSPNSRPKAEEQSPMRRRSSCRPRRQIVLWRFSIIAIPLAPLVGYSSMWLLLHLLF